MSRRILEVYPLLRSPFLDISSVQAPSTTSKFVKNLPEWTENLAAAIKSLSGDSRPKAQVQASIAGNEQGTSEIAKEDNTFVKVGEKIERTLLNPYSSLKELGLVGQLDEITENLRAWFSKKIIKPLWEDIKEVSASFSTAGLDHLSPFHPASFGSSSIMTGSVGGLSVLKNHISISPVTASQPQSLLDLAQNSKDDPMVQKRLKIEKFLSFASLAPRRSHVISRIEAMSKGTMLTAFNFSTLIDNDSDILWSLFCTFMDENLPSSDFYDHQPFSGKHFVPLNESPSNRPEALQIILVAPQEYQFLTGKHIYTSYPGHLNMFHAIVFMVEYVERRREGFLGIGNINSQAIDLGNILSSDNN